MQRELATRIHDQVYKSFYDYKTTIFLCGAEAGKTVTNSVREQIAHAFTKEWFSYQYELFYPEDLFDELLYGPHHQDLITLENILATSVDAVVLVVESYGASAELGAFASNILLRMKLVCVVNNKFKKDKSFINYGPLRLLHDTKHGTVVHIDFNDVQEGIKRIRMAVSKVRKATAKKIDVTNVVQAHNFILTCVYLLEPISRDTLVQFVNYACHTGMPTCSAITTGALSILNKRREITLTPNGYKLTQVGMARFTNPGKVLDEMRIAVLNWKLRGKRLQF